MSVTRHGNQLLQNPQQLYHFLSRCQQLSEHKDQTRIVSISLKIDPVDPLAVFQALADVNQPNFYFEKQNRQQNFSPDGQLADGRIAIAAIGAVAQLKTAGQQRFQQVKTFIRSISDQAIIAGDLTSSFAGLHFFCSFAFADQPDATGITDFPGATVFLPKWQISQDQNQSLVVINLALEAGINLESTVADLWQKFEKIRAIRHRFWHPIVEHSDLFSRRDVTTTQHFKQSVRSALEMIQAHRLNKIVLAHAIDVTSPLPFHLTHSLNNLRRLYPDCYVFSVSDGNGRSFMGASPERLVCLHRRQLMTDALAGSAPRGQTGSEDARLANALLSSSKEMHEHQVVVDFITRQLSQLGLQPQSAPLQLLQLSNIQHLHTPIRATVPETVHLLDILAALHPTPAVAGMPRGSACDHIDRFEPFERSLYAAPIGWINHHGDGEFAVGIRSAFIHGCHARLFAGAGIVAGSDPDRELAEVQLKLQALLAALE